MAQFDSLVESLTQTIDCDEIVRIAHKLGDLGDLRAVPVLIELLKNTNNSRIRNAAAVGLRELKDNRALSPLLNQLEDERTQGNRGTLMYALETLDSRDAIGTIVKLMCAGEYEVVSMGLRVLEAQSENFAPKAKLEAIQILQDCMASEEHPQWRRAMISNAIIVLGHTP